MIPRPLRSDRLPADSPVVVLGSAEARAVLAVLQGAADISAVVAATGLSRSTAHSALRTLCSHGLVSWPPGTQGTLRPACRRVA